MAENKKEVRKMSEKTATAVKAPENALKPQRERIMSIDRFRGAVIFSMIFFQMLKDFKGLELLSRIAEHDHEKGIEILPGMMLADVIAPMFMFAIALTIKSSYESRKAKYGTKKTVCHFLSRYSALIGIGGILCGVNTFLGDTSFNFNHMVDYIFVVLTFAVLGFGLIALICNIKPLKKAQKVFKKILFVIVFASAALCVITAVRDFVMIVRYGTEVDTWGYWLVLQAIGAAGLITLAFINFKTYIRAIAAVVMLGAYGIFHEIGNNVEVLDKIAQGGFLGSFAWGSMVILGTVMADLYFADRAKRSRYLIALPILGVAAFAVSMVSDLNFGSVSPSFVLVALFISSVAFIIFDFFNFYKGKFDPLSWWGKNPILMYLLEFAFVGGMREIIGSGTMAEASDVFGVCYCVIMALILTLIAYILNKKNKIIKL